MFGLIKKSIDIGFNINCKFFKMNFSKNQECKVRKVIVNIEYMTYPYSLKVNRCNGNCNNISNPYSRVYMPDIIKNITVKIFYLMTLTNKMKQIILH